MEPNAILAISSLDRYNTNQNIGGQFASISDALANQYNGTGQPCNNFQVGGFGALIYGYIKKIVVSQTQLEYNVPTVIPGSNDRFFIVAYNTDTGISSNVLIELPYGYYTPEELAPVIQMLLSASSLPIGITVSYSAAGGSYSFEPNLAPGQNFYIYFPNITQIKTLLVILGFQETAYVNILKCYKLLGMDVINSNPRATQTSNVQINFLYTPYVDIFSTALTKYQKVKDNTTNASSDSTLVARIFLSGEGTPQNTGGEEIPISGYIQTSNFYPLGSRPFVVVQDANSPKVIRWSKDETVYALDFQLRDKYGDLLYTRYNPSTVGIPITPPDVPVDFYYTEFQMTLMCIEGERG